MNFNTRTTSLLLGCRLGGAVLLLFFTLAVAAQPPYNSRIGRFQVDQKKGCASLTINLTNLLVGDCTGAKPCSMTFGDGSPAAQNQFVHTYTTPGTYTLSVLYQSIGADDIVITVDQNLQPNFEIYSCSGNRAAIKVIDNNYNQYVIDFDNNGTPEFTLPFSNNILTGSFTYAPPGTYTASVRGRDLNSADNCTAKTQSFTSVATLTAPTINKITSVDASNITMDFTTAVHVQYRLEVALNNSTTFQLYKTLYGVNTLAVSDLKLDDNFYCFRLGAFDPCTNSTLYSNIMCTNKLVVTPKSDTVVVKSNTAGPVVSYSISRNSTPYVTVAASPFNDTDVVCKTSYCYQVTTNYGGGRTSVSLEKCATSFSNKVPTAIDNATASVAGNTATLTWTQDPKFVPTGYSIRRSSGAGSFLFYASASASPYTDNGYTTGSNLCYQVDYIDRCDNLSFPGTVICPIQLSGTLSSTNAISVIWTGYRGWKAGVKNYVLEKYSVQGSLIQSLSKAPTDTTFLDNAPDPDNQYIRYVVRAVPNDPAMDISLSNEIIIIRNSNLFYPTAFTPDNGDNLNDGFIVQGQYIVKIRMSIFDRWGVLLFSTEKNEPWDGTSNGKLLPPSTYIWKVEITDKAGRTYSQEGTIALMR
ncbi:MAG: gliding motility-associated C-terminal domain-containing protein [Cyclobacteriaceae bacterium]|nr:gliding motility-associated C-terminal domain-containing protein [Cyclobacteriaceae bacterium]